MIPRKSIPIVLLLCIALAGAARAARDIPTYRNRSPLVEKTIADVARRFKATEYCQFRKYQTLYDLDGDRRDDCIVLFTIEGIGGKGNDHDNYMAIFLSGRRWKPLTTKTGGRGTCDAISVEATDGRIILRTLVYLPSDTLCCPSGQGTLVYGIQGEALQLLERTGDGTAPPSKWTQFSHSQATGREAVCRACAVSQAYFAARASPDPMS